MVEFQLGGTCSRGPGAGPEPGSSMPRSRYHERGGVEGDVEGPDEVYICRRCVMLCKQLIEGECRRLGVAPRLPHQYPPTGNPQT